MRFIKKTHLITLGTLVAGVAIGWQLKPSSSQPTPASAPKSNTRSALSAQLVTVSTTPMPLSVSATGGIYPWQEAIIGSEVNGLAVKQLFVDVGDFVTKGQVLAKLDARIGQAELDQLKANLQEALAQAKDAKLNANRARQLDKTGALSEVEIAQLLTTAEVANARVNSLIAQIRANQTRLSYTTIYAPDAGVISSKTATLGQVVNVGAELFRLIRQQRLEWRAELPDQDLQSVRIGQQVSLQLNANTQIMGTVGRIAPSLNTATRRGLVYVYFSPTAEQQHLIRAGSFLRGLVHLGTTDALSLPVSALVSRDGFHYAFIATAMKNAANPQQRVVSAQKVQLGRIVDGRVEILQGLKAGQQVVAQGAGFLSHGDIISVAPASPSKQTSPK